MKKILSFILLILSVFLMGCSSSKSEDQKLLEELDNVIKEHSKYDQAIEEKIDKLNKVLSYTPRSEVKTRFEVLGELFDIYRSYRVNKAREIAQLRLELSRQLDEECQEEALMNNADALYKSGNYHAAFEELKKNIFRLYGIPDQLFSLPETGHFAVHIERCIRQGQPSHAEKPTAGLPEGCNGGESSGNLRLYFQFI